MLRSRGGGGGLNPRGEGIRAQHGARSLSSPSRLPARGEARTLGRRALVGLIGRRSIRAVGRGSRRGSPRLLAGPVSELRRKFPAWVMRASISSSFTKFSNSTTQGCAPSLSAGLLSTRGPSSGKSRTARSNRASRSPGARNGASDTPSRARSHRLAGSRRWQYSHETAQFTVIQPGFLRHSPRFASRVHCRG